MAKKWLTVNLDDGAVYWEDGAIDHESDWEWKPIFSILRKMELKGEVENWVVTDEWNSWVDEETAPPPPKIGKPLIWDAYDDGEGYSVVYDAEGDELGRFYASRGLWDVFVKGTPYYFDQAGNLTRYKGRGGR